MITKESNGKSKTHTMNEETMQTIVDAMELSTTMPDAVTVIEPAVGMSQRRLPIPETPEHLPIRPGPFALVSDEGQVTDYVQISPQMAQYILRYHNSGNRPEGPGYIDGMTRDRLSGKWMRTHQGIAFFRTGRLCDGQTRLRSIANSGVTCIVMVTWNLDEEAKRAVDCGRKRSLRDSLAINGRNADCQIGASIRAMVSSGAKDKLLTVSEYAEYFEAYEEAISFVTKHMYHKAKIGTTRLRQSMCMAAVARAYYNEDLVPRSTLERFCSIWMSGEYVAGPVEAGGDGPGIRGILSLRDSVMTQSRGGSASKSILYRKMEAVIMNFVNQKRLVNVAPVASEIFRLPSVQEMKERREAATAAESMTTSTPEEKVAR